MEKNLDKLIAQIEKEFAAFPEQEIVTQQEEGKEVHYLVTKKDGDRIYERISDESLEEVTTHVEKIKSLRKDFEKIKKRTDETICRTDVIMGNDLREKIEYVKSFKKRECFDEIQDYIHGETRSCVFILYGLRRTGKTTLMYQTIADMDDDAFEKAAFMPIKSGDTLTDVEHDLKVLRKRGVRYVFIDEATYMDDFVKGAAVLADTYAGYGMKIILSGTYSLGFKISSNEQLFDRCHLLHTTFIPYREFETLLGIGEIDDYLRYGGTLSESGTIYNSGNINADDYVNAAIAENIQKTLKDYDGDGCYKDLAELAQKGELVNLINRVVEDETHRFTTKVLTRKFNSNDRALSSHALQSDMENPSNILEKIDKEQFNDNLRKMLGILNDEERTVEISEKHAEEIEDYLSQLDVVNYIDYEKSPNKSGKPTRMTVITQPGLRYAQADALIESLLKDETFNALSADDKTRFQERIRSEICGRMMEEMVLLETKLSNPDKRVFKFRDTDAEVDMVVANKGNPHTCNIYEIKHSTDIYEDHYKHLTDDDTCAKVEHLAGKILGKYVIYRGNPDVRDGITYLNVEEYLKGLKPCKK